MSSAFDGPLDKLFCLSEGVPWKKGLHIWFEGGSAGSLFNTLLQNLFKSV